MPKTQKQTGYLIEFKAFVGADLTSDQKAQQVRVFADVVKRGIADMAGEVDKLVVQPSRR